MLRAQRQPTGRPPSAATSSRAGGVRPGWGRSFCREQTDRRTAWEAGRPFLRTRRPSRPAAEASLAAHTSRPWEDGPLLPCRCRSPRPVPGVLTTCFPPLLVHVATPFLCQRSRNLTWGAHGPQCKCPPPDALAAGSGREQGLDPETPSDVSWARPPEKGGRARCAQPTPLLGYCWCRRPTPPGTWDLMPRTARMPAAGPRAASQHVCLSQTFHGCPNPRHARAPRDWCPEHGRCRCLLWDGRVGASPSQRWGEMEEEKASHPGGLLTPKCKPRL